MLPPPEGLWGMPPEMLNTIPGYGGDVAKNRAEARKIMEKLGYGPNKRLEVKISARNVASYRDPAVILIDQLKEIYIDGDPRHGRDRQLAHQGNAQGLRGGAERDRQRRR